MRDTLLGEFPQRVSVDRATGASTSVLLEAAEEVQTNGVVLMEQSWFWTGAWQAGEAEASREFAEGQGRVFDSSEDFLASFDD